MRHVNHQDSTHLISNLAHAGIVPLAAVSRTATDDELRFVLKSELFHFIIIHASCLFLQVITDRLVDNAAGVDEGAVAEVAAMVEVQAHEGIARIEASQEDGRVSLSARVRLHVSILGSEKLADAVDSELLNFVHHLTSAIIALARITFGIFVC